MKKAILLFMAIFSLSACTATLADSSIPFVSEAFAKKRDAQKQEQHQKDLAEALSRQTAIFNESCEYNYNMLIKEVPEIKIKDINDYNDFSVLHTNLYTILGKAAATVDKDCHPKASYGESRSCVVNLSNLECYKKLQSKTNEIQTALTQFKDTVYTKEAKEFKSKYGGDYRGNFNFCISEYANCSCPKFGDVFIVLPRYAQVFQNLGNAALLTTPYYDYKELIYINSSFNQPDGAIIDRDFAIQAAGLKTYQNAFGTNRTVCSYKILNLQKLTQRLAGFSFYGK